MHTLIDEARSLALKVACEYRERIGGSYTSKPLNDIIFAHIKPLIDRLDKTRNQLDETCGLLSDSRALLDETRHKLDETYVVLNETRAEMDIIERKFVDLRMSAAAVEEIARREELEDTILSDVISDMREVLAHSYF